MRIGGLDVSDRRLGVAISDELGWTAQGLCVVTRTSLDADRAALRTCFAEYAPTTSVVGLPKNMNGALGPQAEKVMAFARAREDALDVSRAQRKKVIDKAAALFVRQGHLDGLAAPTS